jgi:hypothetical protein
MKKQMIKGATATVNVMAARGRKEAVKNIQRQFTNRNTFTTRQTQFTPMPESKYIKLSAIQSTLGATDKAPWMKRQEEGGLHTPSQGKTLAIPTNIARGNNSRRPVIAKMRVSSIGKKRRIRSPTPRDYAFWFRSEKARKVARAWKAFKTGKFLPIGDSKEQRNLFLVTGFHAQKVAKGKGYTQRAKHRGIAFELKQVYKFDKPATKTEPEPWLLPASEKVARQVQAIFNAQMKKLGM